ncbi:ComF family protein [Burkholderia sp. Ax-1719]|uniref:ComF family protein n=1 Tax=Burkholderia sp. Ax-1719 TaxID=2608334 RepID=UPI00141DBF88|nr:ComF family protein [Burkholderia sp. Ax-1719]NIE67839.1 ComF family protein [Burkholderia sp. Ax-1719]
MAMRAYRNGQARWPRLVQLVLSDLLPNYLPTLLPSACPLCGNLPRRSLGVRSPAARPRGGLRQWDSVLCAACDAAYWNEARLRCAVCALPLSGSRSHQGRHRGQLRCDVCTKAPPAFDATVALADYRAPLDALARGLKFGARLGLGEEFARRLARAADDALDPADAPVLIVPVPLSRERLIARGYNQAWQIAKPLARALGTRADATLVRRTLHTAAQSRLDRDTRRRNVGRAFALKDDGDALSGLHIGVVDDVMTSGATLDALAHLLKTAGARRVTNFVALRTPKD